MNSNIHKTSDIKHIPVLLSEAVDALSYTNSGIYVDATLGAGGYSHAILDNLFAHKLNGSSLICFDLDIETIDSFLKSLGVEADIIRQYNGNLSLDKAVLQRKEIIVNVYLVNQNFSKVSEYIDLVQKDNPENSEVYGIVADLGLNSDQLDNKSGFSFQNNDQELDMRLDSTSQVRAIDMLNALGHRELTKIFEKYSDLVKANFLSIKIKNYLKTHNYSMKVGELKAVIDHTFGKELAKKFELHAKVFQALRIAVNTEYDNLEQLIQQGFQKLSRGGKFAIVSFHSGEDRIVKTFIREHDREDLVDNTKNSIIKASYDEVNKNPRSRSAKMRVFSKK